LLLKKEPDGFWSRKQAPGNGMQAAMLQEIAYRNENPYRFAGELALSTAGTLLGFAILK
jgi:hypothetical protein